jgi:hypothetical protein
MVRDWYIYTYTTDECFSKKLAPFGHEVSRRSVECNSSGPIISIELSPDLEWDISCVFVYSNIYLEKPKCFVLKAEGRRLSSAIETIDERVSGFEIPRRFCMAGFGGL